MEENIIILLNDINKIVEKIYDYSSYNEITCNFTLLEKLNNEIKNLNENNDIIEKLKYIKQQFIDEYNSLLNLR
jgi:hypothetical protein